MDDKLITQHCIVADAPTFYSDGWVDAEFEVYEDSLIRAHSGKFK